jgi:hypothetical protein
MRHEPSFLKDILSACPKIEAIVAGTDEDSFLKGEILPAAVLHHLTVTGEAISRLSVDLRERHSTSAVATNHHGTAQDRARIFRFGLADSLGCCHRRYS